MKQGPYDAKQNIKKLEKLNHRFSLYIDSEDFSIGSDVTIITSLRVSYVMAFTYMSHVEWTDAFNFCVG